MAGSPAWAAEVEAAAVASGVTWVLASVFWMPRKGDTPVAVECIHGFDEGMCDSCFPKKAPEVTAPPRRTPPRTAGSSIPRGAASATGSKAKGAATAKKPLDLSAQRIFHVTHVSNLAAIIEHGAILAAAKPSTDAATDAAPHAQPQLDVSSDVTRELRSTAEVNPGAMVSEFVPFFLSPEATNWVELLSGAEGVHWSDAARTANPTDFVVLAGTVGAIGDEVVVSDGDAAGSVTRFATNAEAVDRMLRRLLADEFSLITAEVLAPSHYKLEDVALIGVANDRTRDAVRALLKGAGVSPKVAVYPPWFVPSLSE